MTSMLLSAANQFISPLPGMNSSAIGGIRPLPPSPTGINRGICSLSWQDQTFRFRTNPNEIWWDYELLTKVEETYGGRVIQLLGTRLGDLRVKVDCGNGGWPYLMQVVNYLRNLLSDQRNGNPATFRYTARNWQLKVYAMSMPFEDQMQATIRELELNFKIQEDVSGMLSQVTLDAELLRLQDGVYGIGEQTHNKYNDSAAGGTGGTLSAPSNPNTPGYASSGITNAVDSSPQGNNPLGANPLSSLGSIGGIMPSIPGVSGLTKAFGM